MAELTGYSSNGLNQYTDVNGVALGYDDAGNLTSDGTWSYLYDAENRLVRASNGATGLVADYGYGPKGRRVLKSVRSSAQASAVVTEYLYEGDEPIADYDGIGNVLRRYAHGANVDERLVYRSYDAQSGALTDELYYRANHQGSIIAMADAAAARTAVYTYDAYGTPGEAEDGQPFRYTGRRYDPETGLYYYRARYYSATLGRFLQTDPIGYEDNMNMYGYTNNDPVNNTDPTGLAGYSARANGGRRLGPEPQVSESGRAAISLALDFTPIVGDIKGIAEAIADPTVVNVVAAVVGLVPGVGDAAGKALKNSDLVVRGGTNTAERFANGSGVTTRADGTLDGVSVNSAPDASVEQLSQGIPNGQIGVTTVGEVRKAGGDVVPSPTRNNPNHCTMCGVTPEKAEGLFTPTIPNPDRMKK